MIKCLCETAVDLVNAIIMILESSDPVQ